MESQRNDESIIIEIDDDLIEIEQMRVKQSFFTKHKDKVIKALFLTTLALTGGFVLISTFDTTNYELQMHPRSPLADATSPPVLYLVVQNKKSDKILGVQKTWYHVGLQIINNAVKINPESRPTSQWYNDNDDAGNCKYNIEKRELDAPESRVVHLEYNGDNGGTASMQYSCEHENKYSREDGSPEQTSKDVIRWKRIELEKLTTLPPGQNYVNVLHRILQSDDMKEKFVGTGNHYNMVTNNCVSFVRKVIEKLKKEGHLTHGLKMKHYQYDTAKCVGAAGGAVYTATALLLCSGLLLVTVPAMVYAHHRWG